MSRKRNMQNYQEILYRLRLNQSIRQIHRDTKSHKTIIRKIKKVAELKQWLDCSIPIPTINDIQTTLDSPNYQEDRSHRLDEAYQQIKEWHESGHSNVVIHSLLKSHFSVSLSTVNRYVNKRFPKYVDPVMLRSQIPGEVAEVDFGYLGIIYDVETRKNKKAWLFSMRLRYSRKAYRLIVFDQTQKTFYHAHIYAFEYFNGIPAKVVLDNLKAGVIQASISNPILNASYKELARHYGFLISPCDPCTPKHKGGVENDIKYAKRNFWPIFCEKEKLMGREPPASTSMQTELEKWNSQVAEKRLIGGIGKTVSELFQEEAPLLRPLPKNRWDLVEWKSAKVGKDWRIAFDSAYYSVPYQLIGEDVMICASSTIIKVFFKYEEVALHVRAREKWQYQRKTEHAPPEQEDVLKSNRESLLIRAEIRGGYIQQVIDHFLNDKIQDRLKAARLVLNLEKTFGHLRLEAACKRAVHFQTFSYDSIRNILEKKLDLEPLAEIVKAPACTVFRFARSAGYFEILNEGVSHEFN